MITIYLPQDTTAVALGADQIAGKISEIARQRNLSLEVIRNGSRGLFWLEPLLEIETQQGRVALGPLLSLIHI